MSYYELRISEIPVGLPVDAIDGKLYCGCAIEPIGQEALAHHRESEPDRSPVLLAITDNGIHGDGARLRVLLDHPQFPSRRRRDIVDLHLPDESLPIIHEAIGAILRLRSSQL